MLVLAACAPRPVLQSKTAAVPVGVDLSGSWEIRPVDGNRPLREGEQPQTVQMPQQPSARSTQQQRRRPGSSGADIWIFLENGRKLKITQTADGLFISFDRAVVEAYTFGENRMVSVGPIEAQRVSGWEGRKLVLETMDKQTNTLSETWSLEEDDTVLVRDIVVTKGSKQLYATRQVFDRA